MSLITRCPTCETMFKVVPDQLRVSEGWVRCGQCAEIFDATQHMLPSPEADAPEARVSAPAPLAAARAPTATIASAPPVAPAQPTPMRVSVRTQPAEAEAQRASEDPETDPQTIFLDQESELDAQASPVPSATQAPSAEPAPTPAVGPGPGPAPTWPDLRAPAIVRPAQQGDESAPEVSFLRSQDKPSIWKRPAVRWTLVLLLVLLLALLALQVVRKERDRIAALAPATRTALQTMCELTGCVLSPLRQIESLVIDSSSFSRERGDDYRLGFSLRNTAAIDIALPAIELALTDAQDQPVIRKVIAPAQFAPGVPSLARSSVWTGSLALSVAPGASTERIAGYRLLAFYP